MNDDRGGVVTSQQMWLSGENQIVSRPQDQNSNTKPRDLTACIVRRTLNRICMNDYD